jgi:hypothetical protein
MIEAHMTGLAGLRLSGRSKTFPASLTGVP